MHDLQTIIHRNNERVAEYRQRESMDTLLRRMADLEKAQAALKIIPAIPPSQNSPEGTP